MSYAAPYRLQIARQKLQAIGVPFLLRAVAFLRISCSVMPEKNAYSQLMKALFEHAPLWWTQCQITAHGDLRSTDRKINQYLQPIKALHRPEQLKEAA
jgi:hypothetical protein